MLVTMTTPAPSKSRAFVYRRSDGFQVVGSGTSASVELIIGHRQFFEVPLNYSAARALTVFLLWWWVFNAWFGLRRRIEAFRLNRELDKKISG
jgi:hypothetical protein